MHAMQHMAKIEDGHTNRQGMDDEDEADPCTLAYTPTLHSMQTHAHLLTHPHRIPCRAMDGDEAMQWLAVQETLPDLVLLDCMMPNMSGHEFCAELRQVFPLT